MRTRSALMVLPMAMLAGCGGESDEESIRAIIDERRSDPASICEHMTAELLKEVGGPESCRQLAQGDDNQDPDTEIDGIDVEGDRATVRIAGADGEQTIAFRREDGEWRLTRSP
ncbi:MAG: hypothetical protein WKF96_05405 [Solirubrobacteraceae bacterium]